MERDYHRTMARLGVCPRPGAVRLALAALLVACAPLEAGSPSRAAEPPTEALPSEEPPTRLVGQPIVADQSAAQREERAIAILRRSLRRRGLGAEVVAGPMAVVPSRDHPDAELALEGPEAGELAAAWPSGAALVATAGGRWWVWEYGSTAPADELARALASRVGTRGL
jgi:hypothetical protein